MDHSPDPTGSPVFMNRVQRRHAEKKRGGGIDAEPRMLIE